MRILVSFESEKTPFLGPEDEAVAWCDQSSMIDNVLYANGPRPIGWGDSGLARMTL